LLCIRNRLSRLGGWLWLTTLVFIGRVSICPSSAYQL